MQELDFGSDNLALAIVNDFDMLELGDIPPEFDIMSPDIGRLPPQEEAVAGAAEQQSPGAGQQQREEARTDKPRETESLSVDNIMESMLNEMAQVTSPEPTIPRQQPEAAIPIRGEPPRQAVDAVETIEVDVARPMEGEAEVPEEPMGVILPAETTEQTPRTSETPKRGRQQTPPREDLSSTPPLTLVPVVPARRPPGRIRRQRLPVVDQETQLSKQTLRENMANNEDIMRGQDDIVNLHVVRFEQKKANWMRCPGRKMCGTMLLRLVTRHHRTVPVPDWVEELEELDRPVRRAPSKPEEKSASQSILEGSSTSGVVEDKPTGQSGILEEIPEDVQEMPEAVPVPAPLPQEIPEEIEELPEDLIPAVIPPETVQGQEQRASVIAVSETVSEAAPGFALETPAFAEGTTRAAMMDHFLGRMWETLEAKGGRITFAELVPPTRYTKLHAGLAFNLLLGLHAQGHIVLTQEGTFTDIYIECKQSQ